MVLRSSQGKVEGDRPASAETPRRQSAVYSLRSMSLPLDDHKECRSLSHLGILMPLYLMPLFFLGTKYGGCLYCVLLPLLLWAFNSLPKPSAALVHLVTVPLLGLLAAEDIARQYLSADVLTVALVLCLIIVVDRWSKLVLFLAYGVCARFGLRRKRLFVGTCLCSFAFAWLFSGPLVAVTLLYFLDRVMSTIFKENMDHTPDGVGRSSRHGSVQESTSLRSVSAADQVLFDRLAHMAMSLKKLESRKWPYRLPRSGGNAYNVAAPTASCKDAVSQERTEGVPSSADPVWAVRAIEVPPLEALGTGAYPSAALPSLPDSGLTTVVTDQRETLNPDKSRSSTQANEILKGESKQLQSQQETGALPSLPSSLIVPLQGRNDKQSSPHSATDGSPDKKIKPNRQLSLKAMFRRRNQRTKNRPSTDADGVSPASPRKPRSRLFRSVSFLASRIARKPIGDAKLQQTDVESSRRHNTDGVPSPESNRQGGLQPDLTSERTAPVATAASGGFMISSERGTAFVPGYPFPSAQDDSANSNAPPSQYELAAVAHIQGAGPVTGNVMQPPIAPAASATHLGAQNTLPSITASAGSSVSVRLASVVPDPELLTKPIGAGIKTGRTTPERRSNLPSENSGFAKASEPFQCEEKGLPHEAKSYGATSTETEPQPAATESEKSSLSFTGKDPVIISEKRSQKTKKDSLGKSLHHHSRHRKSKTSLPGRTGGFQAICEENREHVSRESSAANLSANKERSTGKKVSSTPPEEKKHQSKSSIHKDVPAKTNQKSDVKGTDEAHGSHLDEKGEKVKGKHSHKMSKDSLNNQPHLHPQKTIEKYCSLPDGHVHGKSPSAQLAVSMPVTTEAPEAQSKRGSTRERHHGNYGEDHSNGSRKSKTSVKSRLGWNVPEVKDHAAETLKTSSAQEGEQKHANKRLSSRDVSSKFIASDKLQAEQPTEVNQSSLSMSALKASTLAKEEEPIQTAGPAPSEETRRSQNYKLTTDSVPLAPQPQRAASSATALNASGPTEFDATSTMELKRKQSGVSFDADILGEMRTESVPLMSRVTLHPEEAPAQPSQERRQSIILKTSSLTATPFRRRRESSVDFRGANITIISPLQQLAGAPPLRRLSVSSRASSGSISSLGADPESRGRIPITLRRMTRTRSSYGFEDTISRRPSIGGQIASQDLSLLRMKKANCARTDIHNAFLLGSALMIVLGNICSFRSDGNNLVLRRFSNTADTANQSVSTFIWTIATLPGCLVALFTCTVVIWLVYIRPHEPEPLSPENIAVMRNARDKAASSAKRRGVECAYATYFVLFSLSYGPPLVLEMEPRNTLLVALASMILLTSALTSGVRAAFEFIRNIWEMLPWGVLLILGATFVASELVQAHSLLIEAYNLMPISFWEERTMLEVQTLLAFAASLLAEAMDKQVLVDIMMPVVAQISEIKQTRPSYFAIPMVVGASSNFIMPTSVPMALLHDLSRVTFWKLFLLGLLSKIVVISMVIVTVNMMHLQGLL